MTPPGLDSAGARAAAARAGWRDTIEIARDVVTSGAEDFRPALGLVRWPDVRGARCLVLAPGEGLLAFEAEWRGAAEVAFARFVPDAPADERFRIASSCLGSSVALRPEPPADLGEGWDVVVCVDPIRPDIFPHGLSVLRRLCGRWLLSVQRIDLLATALSRGRAVVTVGRDVLPSSSGHRAVLESSGFTLDRATKPFVVPFGTGARERRPRFVDGMLERFCQRPVRAGSLHASGIAYGAALARRSS